MLPTGVLASSDWDVEVKLHDTVDGGFVRSECLADDKVDSEADGCEYEKDISIGFAWCHVGE